MRALLIAALCLSGCGIYNKVLPALPTVQVVNTAEQYVGLTERQDRAELRELLSVDPVQTEWCAAFVNAILELESLAGSDSVSAYPLTARSFLSWGNSVAAEHIRRGDIVVFPRGNQGWQGHVGFYVETVIVDGVEFWLILGGNQDQSVSYKLYDPHRAIGIRRWTADEIEV